MTELVECNTQLHKTLQGLWSDALTQHKLQQHLTLEIEDVSVSLMEPLHLPNQSLVVNALCSFHGLVIRGGISFDVFRKPGGERLSGLIDGVLG